ncbi:MAG: DUF3795 domain-containing protein [Candidatus Woesearchaeota archaeon]|nr:MAG: DUF3795 domain-containing protein [Candidatus Woesearchaeota archaeon]
MDGKIAICGLDCSSCPAFIATQTNDNELRKITAEKWSEEFGHNDPPLKPEDVNCRGCLSQRLPLFMHCDICEVRACGIERGIKNCKECEDYKCDAFKKLEEQLK